MATGVEDRKLEGPPTPAFGATADQVLATPRIDPPPATLEEARNRPGRAEQIEQLDAPD